ncbi:hypothetical protein ACLB2K_005699 [Fragaria x ananassa]
MEPELKRTILEDLDRFVRRKNFYRKVGKAWKRGYLLHGPPGTGKSSLVAAMANYLKFDIYDLELASVRGNYQLRNVLLSTTNRSILVTLSGLLNFIDSLWPSCGDERIIVFTTNHKDKLDPVLLRPGRMDLHIHLSYCTPNGFKPWPLRPSPITEVELSLVGNVAPDFEAKSVTAFNHHHGEFEALKTKVLGVSVNSVVIMLADGVDTSANCVCSPQIDDDLEIHLMRYGVDPDYDIWCAHGEDTSPSIQVVDNESSNHIDVDYGLPEVLQMYKDAHYPFSDGVGSSNPISIEEEYKKKVEEAEVPLYPGCKKKYTRLSATLILYKFKADNDLPTKTFDELLEVYKDMLPDVNIFPESDYTIKKILERI